MIDDEDSFFTMESDDSDDFDYYVSYINALEEENVSKKDIIRELMEEFDIEQIEAKKILKRYYEEERDYDDDDEYEDDFVEDDDYGDGNREE